ncbi:IclR family transcriptional regulator [Ottowia sp. VDI28]|uniref:IclR family transcriptional regulator n=1 Tax=Ottowia sp. VDI28 TaxID=3133968 RepID=UPI003C30A61F
MKAVQAGAKEASQEQVDYSGPRSPLRVMQIVELLAESPRGLSLTQLSEQLEIPKTSVLSHLRVLLAAQYLSQQDARYLLGPAALRMGLIISAGASVPVVVRPLLEELVEATGETAMLAMLDEREMEAVYVARSEGIHAVRFSPSIGARRPLYCTAFGRALLASQDEQFLTRYFGSLVLQRVTNRTVTSERALRQILQGIRSSGVASTQEEHTRDAGAIAAPIIEGEKPVRYAMGIALPVSRAEGQQALRKLEQAVTDAASKARRALGH